MSEGRRTDASAEAVLPGALLGIGLMGAVDEILFHQLLQWHHFFVGAHSFWQIFSDGVFNAFTTATLVAAAVLLWRRRARLAPIVTNRRFAGAALLGMGGFQLFDGTVNHKLLQLHPVRVEVTDQLPYDVGWVASAVVLLLAGWLVWRSSSETGSDQRGR